MSKPFASLSGSMLARKTLLRPSLQTPPDNSNDADWNPAAAVAEQAEPEPAPGLAEIVAIPTAAEPGAPLLARKPAPIVAEPVLAEVVPLVRPERAPVPPIGLKPLPVRRTRPAAFTLRLDPDRHLRLRLACTLAGRSAQALVTAAVDRMIADHPEIEPLAARIPAVPAAELAASTPVASIVRPLWDSKP